MNWPVPVKLWDKKKCLTSRSLPIPEEIVELLAIMFSLLASSIITRKKKKKKNFRRQTSEVKKGDIFISGTKMTPYFVLFQK